MGSDFLRPAGAGTREIEGYYPRVSGSCTNCIACGYLKVSIIFVHLVPSPNLKLLKIVPLDALPPSFPPTPMAYLL